MANVKVLTDSTSDIPPEIAKKYDIDVVPLNIFFGEERYKDGVNISASDVYKRIIAERNPWPTTSQPSAREFLPYYEKAFNENGYDSVISIHVSQNMSGTMNSVNLAKQMLPDKDLVLVDSETVSHPLGMFGIEIAKLAKEGKNKEEIMKIIETKFQGKANICAVVDTLEFLHRGGRIGRAKKVLGTLLNKKPLIEVTEGTVNSFGSVKGHDEGFNNMVEMIPKIFKERITDSVWLGYAEDDTFVKKLYDLIKDLPDAPSEIEIIEIGPTVGVHIGPGVMTVSWMGEWDNKWFFGK